MYKPLIYIHAASKRSMETDKFDGRSLIDFLKDDSKSAWRNSLSECRVAKFRARPCPLNYVKSVVNRGCSSSIVNTRSLYYFVIRRVLTWRVGEADSNIGWPKNRSILTMVSEYFELGFIISTGILESVWWNRSFVSSALVWNVS